MLAGRRPAVPQPRGLRLDFTALRRHLANAGLTPATSSVPLTSGSRDEVAFEEAVLVEGSRVEPRDVGAAESWPGTIAFLDGTQHLDLLGYSGTHPIIGAEVAAAVRERRDRDLVTVVERRRNLLIGRAAALGIGTVMVVAVMKVHLVHGFFMNWSGAQGGEGYEYHLLAIGIAVAILMKGSGALSVDRAVTWGADSNG